MLSSNLPQSPWAIRSGSPYLAICISSGLSTVLLSCIQEHHLYSLTNHFLLYNCEAFCESVRWRLQTSCWWQREYVRVQLLYCMQGRGIHFQTTKGTQKSKVCPYLLSFQSWLLQKGKDFFCFCSPAWNVFIIIPPLHASSYSSTAKSCKCCMVFVA